MTTLLVKGENNMLNRMLLGVIMLFMFAGQIVQADPNPRARIAWEMYTPEQRVQHYKQENETEITHIVVKFRENTGIRLRNGILNRFKDSPLPPGLSKKGIDSDASRVQALANANGRGLNRTFEGLTEEALDSLKENGEALSGQSLEDLNLYHTIKFSKNKKYKQIEKLILQLNKLKSVEIAYAQPKPELATHLTTPDYVGNQGYKDASTNGINANWAAGQPGGKGTGVNIIDIEGAWRTTHEDLPTLFYDSGNHINDLLFRDHGTAVLGVIGAVDNGFGVTGIVPDANLGVQSHNGSASDISNHITLAANQVGSGGIVLLEVHYPGPADATPCTCNHSQCNFLPAEYWQANFAAIQTVTANGVHVVEAAGNGSVNLDDTAYNGSFNRNSRDSGAIMVGASLSTQRAPACFTNFGGRVDVHGWGENVMTTGYGYTFNGGHGNEDQYYWNSFGGTSSASPIVVGAVASVQGIATASGLSPITPAEMRSLLVDNGRPQTGTLTNNIGPMPDIRAAVESLGAGSGTTPTVTISASPNTISSGANSLLTWSATNATNCTASGGWSGSKTISGSQSVSPSSTTNYALSCTGSGGSASNSVTVTVSASSAPTVDFSANPTSISAGGNSLLSWDVSNATSCTASGGWSGSTTTAFNASSYVYPQTTTTYNLSCTGAGGTTDKSVTVSVSASQPPPTVTINANPSSISAGNYSYLLWNSTNATSCTASGGWSGNKALNSGEYVYPTTTTTYYLSCTGAGGTTVQSTTVTVDSPPIINLSASPSSISPGGYSLLSWSTSNATSCSATGGWYGSRNTNGSEAVYPTSSTTYYLTCFGPGGTTTQSLVVSVTESLPTLSFIATPSAIFQGQYSQLSWNATNATSCNLWGGWSGTTPVMNGVFYVYPFVTTTYYMSCSGTGGSVAKFVTVSVY